MQVNRRFRGSFRYNKLTRNWAISHSIVQLDALKQFVWVFDFYKISLLSGQYLYDRPVKSCEINPKLPPSSFRFFMTCPSTIPLLPHAGSYA